MDALSIWASILSCVSIILIMSVEVVNAVGRKFAVPFPCTLELATSLMIICIFLGAPTVASREEHTFVTILTRKLPGSIRRALDAFANLFASIVISMLAWGGWQAAYHSVMRLEVRIGVYNFPIWPFKLMFALGLTLLVMQFLLNAFRCTLDIMEKRYTPD